MILERMFLRRISPSIRHIRRFSVPPQSISAVNLGGDQQNDSVFGSLARWCSGIAIGSSLGLLYWSCNSNSESASLFSFADWSTSTATNESAIGDDQSFSRSVFRKLSLPDYSSKFLFGDAYRRKVFFKYEKRMRLRSPPEKVFEYFATQRSSEGESLMTPADLMRAIVPVFPPSESNLVRDGFLGGERRPGHLLCPPSELLMLFDVNNDGLISFKEYIFFVTLLSIPESRFSVTFKMFDVNKNGEISQEEFKKVMALMRAHNRQGAFHRDGFRPGLKVHGSVENGGLVEYFFGKDGSACLQHDKFVEFMRELNEELVKLEFAHYDYKSRESISAEDFALSMVASADMSHLSKLLDRVDQLKNEPHLRDRRITFEEFRSFAELRRTLQPFSLALFSYGEVNGFLTKGDFQRAASYVCDVSLTENVIEIIFHIFDTNRDGNLSAEEFVRVLHHRERDIAQPVETGFLGFLTCCGNCANNCSIGQLLR